MPLRNPSLPARLGLLTVLALLSLAASPSALLAQSPLPSPKYNPLAWQLALDREGFSPGVLDNNPGFKTQIAVREFQRTHNLPPTGKFDSATAEALSVSIEDCLTTYTIQAADQDAVTGVPKKWQEKAAMKHLGYEVLLDGVAEKFHCSPALLAQLNPGINLSALSPGDVVTVPNVGSLKTPSAHRLEINLSQKIIRVFDAESQLVALFHCSIAAHAEKRPRGTARVVVVTHNPSYSFDPVNWPEVKDVTTKLLIPPGPRNPVGLCWIGLSLPGYGIHGTPHPLLIGKTGSHGCFRMTNWDATRLGKMVTPGIPVSFIESSSAN